MCAFFPEVCVLVCVLSSVGSVGPTDREPHLQNEFRGNDQIFGIEGSFPGIPPQHGPPRPTYYDTSDSYDSRFAVQHAGLPRSISVEPLPLMQSDHELAFNVSWLPSLGPPAREYSLEVISESNTHDCLSPVCYEYGIPGDATWHLVPRVTTPVAETCAVRPGCTYGIQLIAHPWDGHSHANMRVQLDECVAGVCSCAHAPRLPTPAVRADLVTIQGGTAVNVTWTLPPPASPLRLPPVQKQYYFVSIGKQMVTDVHPSPWFSHTVSRKVATEGPVTAGDTLRWTLVPLKDIGRGDEWSDERKHERGDKREEELNDQRVENKQALDVKLMARVSLVDERGCIGPAGNITAYDPVEARKLRIGTYLLWATLGGACALCTAALMAAGARAVKRVLHALRPAPPSAPAPPGRRRPAWFPLQIRTYNVSGGIFWVFSRIINVVGISASSAFLSTDGIHSSQARRSKEHMK